MIETLAIYIGLGVVAFGGCAGFMALNTPTQLAAEIAQSITNEASRWKTTNGTIRRDDGLEVWTTSGRGYVRIWAPTKMDLGMADRRIIWKAYKNRAKFLTIKDIIR